MKMSDEGRWHGGKTGRQQGCQGQPPCRCFCTISVAFFSAFMRSEILLDASMIKLAGCNTYERTESKRERRIEGYKFHGCGKVRGGNQGQALLPGPARTTLDAPATVPGLYSLSRPTHSPFPISPPSEYDDDHVRVLSELELRMDA